MTDRVDGRPANPIGWHPVTDDRSKVLTIGFVSTFDRGCKEADGGPGRSRPWHSDAGGARGHGLGWKRQTSGGGRSGTHHNLDAGKIDFSSSQNPFHYLCMIRDIFGGLYP